MTIASIFNRYLSVGGEELVSNRIYTLLQQAYEMEDWAFSSADWTGPNAPSRLQQAMWMWNNPVAIARLRQLHRDFQPDAWLVHNVYPVASAGVYRLAGELGVPIIQYCHNLRPFTVNGYCWAGDRLAPEGLKKNFWPEILAGSWQGSRVKTAVFASVLTRLHRSGWLENVRHWIAISDFLRDRFIEAGIPAERITTVRHGWDLMNQTAPSAGDDGSFLYIGRLTREKGIPELLEAWNMLGDEAPELVIAGDGPMEAAVQEAAGKLKQLRYAGYVSGEEKRELLRACRALVVPSVCPEALGLVLYEAYDYAKPVIAAASGGLVETVRHGETGFLYASQDTEALANYVRQLHDHVEVAQRMGAVGRAWLEVNTRQEDWLRQIEGVLEKAERLKR